MTVLYMFIRVRDVNCLNKYTRRYNLRVYKTLFANIIPRFKFLYERNIVFIYHSLFIIVSLNYINNKQINCS